MGTKICPKCGEEKSYSAFCHDKSRKDAYDSYCKSCRNDYLKQWRHENRNKMLSGLKAYGREHKEEKRQYDRLYRQRNRDRIRRQKRAWKKTDAGRLLSRKHAQIRLSRINGALFRISNSEIVETCNHGCLFCGATDDLALAHDLPISEGGPTTRANTFCLCRSCNSQMRTNTLAELMMQLPLMEVNDV